MKGIFFTLLTAAFLYVFARVIAFHWIVLAIGLVVILYTLRGRPAWLAGRFIHNLFSTGLHAKEKEGK